MKKTVSLILVLILCLLAFAPAVSAENKVEMYEELLTGTWKVVWRYLPQTAMALNKISDPVKPVNLFVFPGELAKAGMTVTSYLTGDDTGEVWLTLITAGSSHGIVSFDGGFTGRVSLSSDHNTLLLTGLDGAAILYTRTETTDSQE
ncbi:MAG: hypothetical protein IKZ98_00020 [Clostridia bacterium]|nr:hypothetical protein [Clostridia bacterium]